MQAAPARGAEAVGEGGSGDSVTLAWGTEVASAGGSSGSKGYGRRWPQRFQRWAWRRPAQGVVTQGAGSPTTAWASGMGRPNEMG